MRIRLILIAFLVCAAAPPAANSGPFLRHSVATDFQDGCCIDTTFSRPRDVSQVTVPRRVLPDSCEIGHPVWPTKIARQLPWYGGRYNKGNAFPLHVRSRAGLPVFSDDHQQNQNKDEYDGHEQQETAARRRFVAALDHGVLDGASHREAAC